MEDQRLAGGLWIAAGVCCSGLFAVFLGENMTNLGALVRDPVLPGLVLGGAICALLIGGMLVSRPGPSVVRASTVVGVAWLIAFGSLAVTAIGNSGSGDPGPAFSASLITLLGVAGALFAYLVQSRAASRTTR